MTILNTTDLAGWGAAGLTLLTFVCRDMRHLRLLAIFANGAFITYGTLAGLVPVLVLHMALAPINLLRLVQQLGSAKAGPLRQRPPMHATVRRTARRAPGTGPAAGLHARAGLRPAAWYAARSRRCREQGRIEALGRDLHSLADPATPGRRHPG